MTIASSRGHKEIVSFLLDHGWDPNLKGSDGYTALYWASKNGHFEIAKLLLEKGSNPLDSVKDIKDKQIQDLIISYQS